MAERWAGLVLAAGKGTRMRSGLPKVLHMCLERPLVYYPLKALQEAGVEDRVVVVGRGAEQVEAYVTDLGARTALQAEQLGTAHAALCARGVLGDFEGEVLVLCGDTPLVSGPTLKALMEVHQGADLTILTAELEDPTGYGRILRDPESGKVLRVVEERDASPSERRVREINTGIYAVRASLLFEAAGAAGCDNAQGEYYLTDMVGWAVEHGLRVQAAPLASPEEALGVNSRLDLSRAEGILLSRLREAWMERGVTMRMPETVYIGPDAELGRDVEIGPFVVIKGRTLIGEGSSVGPFSVLEGASVPPGSVLRPYTYLFGGG